MAYHKTLYNGSTDVIQKISNFAKTVEGRLGWVQSSDSNYLKITNTQLDMGFEIRLGAKFSSDIPYYYKAFRPKGGLMQPPTYGGMDQLGESGTLHIIITKEIFFYALEDRAGLCSCSSFGKLKTKNSTPESDRPAVYWSPALGTGTITNMFADCYRFEAGQDGHLFVCDQDSNEIFNPTIVPIQTSLTNKPFPGYIMCGRGTEVVTNQFYARDLYLPISDTHILMTPMFATTKGTVYGQTHTFGYADSGAYITSSLAMLTGTIKDYHGYPHFYFKGKEESKNRGFGYVIRGEQGDGK